ncbi:hypothetical protein D3C72_494150 [compost metagenome]
MRATSKENKTATATEMPKERKNMPGMPPMKDMGTNTTTMVMVVATTARPISAVASKAACQGLLPMSMWRWMFSRSTMASSTRMPTTSVKASVVMPFSE